MMDPSNSTNARLPTNLMVATVARFPYWETRYACWEHLPRIALRRSHRRAPPRRTQRTQRSTGLACPVRQRARRFSAPTAPLAFAGYQRTQTRPRRKTRLWGGFARAARRRSVSDHLRVVAPRAARAPSGGLQPSLRRRVDPRNALQGNLEDTPSLRRRRRLGRLGLLFQKSGGLRHEDPRRTLC